MRNKWKARCIASIVAAILSVGLVLGSSVMVMAASEDVLTGQEETQEITAEVQEDSNSQAEIVGETDEGSAGETAEGQKDSAGQAEIVGETDRGQAEIADDISEEQGEDQLEILVETANDQMDTIAQEETPTAEETRQEAIEAIREAGLEGEFCDPLDFDADPTSRSGNGWDWNQETSTLTLNSFWLNLEEYDDDYEAAIKFPDVDTVTIQTTSVILLDYLGVNQDSTRRQGIYCPGNLVIQGDGLFQVYGDKGATGVYVGGSLTITGTGTQPLEVDGLTSDYSYIVEKNLTVSNTLFRPIMIGVVDNNKSNTVIYAGAGIDFSDSEVHVTGGDGPAGTGIHAGDSAGAISMTNCTYLQALDLDGPLTGIINDNGDVVIDGTEMVITVGGGETNNASLITTKSGDVKISNSEITGASDNNGILSGGKVSIENNSVIDVVAADRCVETAGNSELTVTGSFMSAKSEQGSYSVHSSGPATINNSQVYFEALGNESCALTADGKVTFSGKLNYVDLTGTMAAIELYTTTDVTNMPLELKDGISLFSPATATQQYVDSGTTRIFSYSEGTLGIEGNYLKDASTNLLFANQNGLYIEEQPADQTVYYPNGAEYEVKVNNPEKVQSYQWVFENTDSSFQTFDLEGDKGTQPKLVIPVTRQNGRDWYFYCRITDKDGNVLQTRRALLSLNNPYESKTVVYAGWNAIEPGESLDLSATNLGSGTITYDSDGKTIIFDHVILDNGNEGAIWWDRLIPTYGIRIAGYDNEISDYDLILKGDCSMTCPYVQQPSNMAGISLDFEFYGGTMGAKIPVVHVKEDSAEGGTLTITGGGTEFRVLGDLDLNADLTLKNFTEGTISHMYRDGITSYAFNLASGYTADLDVNGIALSTTKKTTICDGAEMKIKMTPVLTSASVAKPAVYIDQGTLEIATGATIDITAHATPQRGLEIDYLGGILLDEGADMTANGAEILIGLSADPGQELYVGDFTAILGGDKTDITLDQTNLSIAIDGTNAQSGTGLYNGDGKVTINGSTVLINATGIASANGLTPEGDLEITDSTVEVNTEYKDAQGRSYGIAANTITIDLENTDGYVKSNVTNATGLAMLAKAGSGDTSKGYDPSYVAKSIVLKGLAKCIVPEKNVVSLTSVPGAQVPFLYLETYYDLNNTNQPCNSVTIAAEEAPGTYEVVSGAGGSWAKGSKDPLVFTFRRTAEDETTFSHFKGIEVDGKTVPEKDSSGRVNYTAKSGSVIISLQSAYLATLSEGQHTLTAIFDDGSVETTFTISPAVTPPTGDRQNVLLWAIFAALALALAVGLIIRMRVRRR